MGCLAGEQRPLERLLNCVEHSRLRLGQVAGEIAQERGLAELAPIARPDDAGGGWRRRESLRERSIVLVRIRRPGRNVDERADLGIDASFGDDHASERMADQHGRTILLREDALR
jgi:hypothetical protein